MLWVGGGGTVVNSKSRLRNFEFVVPDLYSRTSLLRSSIFQELFDRKRDVCLDKNRLQLNIMDVMGYATKITGHLRKLTAQ